MNLKETLKTWLPILATVATFSLWVDTRYMHKTISDVRHIDLKIIILDRELKDWDRRMDKEGYILSPEEQREYDLFKSTIDFLSKERDKAVGLGQ